MMGECGLNVLCIHVFLPFAGAVSLLFFLFLISHAELAVAASLLLLLEDEDSNIRPL
jgi:hypothetical protein